MTARDDDHNGDESQMRPALLLLASLSLLGATHTFAADSSEKSIVELQQDMVKGRTSSAALVRAFTSRIDAIDRRGPQLKSVLALNPQAMEQARQLDLERKEKGPRGPLHGIPILLKDNIESLEPLPTTAGSLALVDNVTGRDAPIVANLRAAGAVILGKTNLSEWANFRSTHSISGWSAVGGLTKNPHVLDRSACGSSSGSAVAVAAGLAVASVGTETDGSIVCPAAMNGIVGLKPTLGLLSGERIVPIAHSQDAPGPMARSVADAGLMLAAMADSQEACAARESRCRVADYVAATTATSLAGKRIGVLRFREGRWPRIEPIYHQALAHLRDAGATLIEVELPDEDPIESAEGVVFITEFRVDLNRYLATAAPAVKVRDLAQLIQFNRTNPRELALFGQELFDRSEATAESDPAVYREALAASKRLATEGLDGLLQGKKLDFLVAPTAGAAWRIDLVNGDHFPGSFSTFAAVAGYPHLTVPMGTVRRLPLGISFIGSPWTEAELLAAGAVFERRARARVVPEFVQSVD